jgi:hypothetical protein
MGSTGLLVEKTLEQKIKLQREEVCVVEYSS